jgi:hypothetical protein
MAQVVFGSPEANKIALRNKLLEQCETIECFKCHGLKTVIVWDHCDCCGNSTEKESVCPQCEGIGQVLEHPNGHIFALPSCEVVGCR